MPLLSNMTQVLTAHNALQHPLTCADPALSSKHAAADPGFVRGQRAVLRQQRQEQNALGDALEVRLQGPF